MKSLGVDYAGCGGYGDGEQGVLVGLVVINKSMFLTIIVVLAIPDNWLLIGQGVV